MAKRIGSNKGKMCNVVVCTVGLLIVMAAPATVARRTPVQLAVVPEGQARTSLSSSFCSDFCCVTKPNSNHADCVKSCEFATRPLASSIVPSTTDHLHLHLSGSSGSTQQEEKEALALTAAGAGREEKKLRDRASECSDFCVNFGRYDIASCYQKCMEGGVNEKVLDPVTDHVHLQLSGSLGSTQEEAKEALVLTAARAEKKDKKLSDRASECSDFCVNFGRYDIASCYQKCMEGGVNEKVLEPVADHVHQHLPGSPGSTQEEEKEALVLTAAWAGKEDKKLRDRASECSVFCVNFGRPDIASCYNRCMEEGANENVDEPATEIVSYLKKMEKY